jgi:hypothetical protein
MRNNDIRPDEAYDWEQSDDEEEEERKPKNPAAANGHPTTSNGPLLNGK